MELQPVLFSAALIVSVCSVLCGTIPETNPTTRNPTTSQTANTTGDTTSASSQTTGGTSAPGMQNQTRDDTDAPDANTLSNSDIVLPSAQNQTGSDNAATADETTSNSETILPSTNNQTGSDNSVVADEPKSNSETILLNTQNQTGSGNAAAADETPSNGETILSSTNIQTGSENAAPSDETQSNSDTILPNTPNQTGSDSSAPDTENKSNSDVIMPSKETQTGNDTSRTSDSSPGAPLRLTTRSVGRTEPTLPTTRKTTTPKKTTSKPIRKTTKNGKNGKNKGGNRRKNGRNRKQPARNQNAKRGKAGSNGQRAKKPTSGRKQKPKPKPKMAPKPVPPPKKKVFAPKPTQDDMFFGSFDVTTTEASMQKPPPDFDPNRKGKKVMPTVDTKNSRAHDGTPCNVTYKSHDTIQTKYMMKYGDGVWEALDCPPNLSTGLVWRQDLCSCGEELVAQDPDDWCAQMGFNVHSKNKHKYFRRHHGVDAAMDCAANLVWSQKNCLCMYDPTVPERPIEQKVTFICKTILNLKFNGNLKNSAGGYHVQPVKLRRRGRLPRIRYMKTAGSSEKAAMIVSQPLEFQAFKGNDFQSQVTYSINFKISPHHLTRTNFMTLFTDECKDYQGGHSKERKPGVSLQFQPRTRTFRLQFRTGEIGVDERIRGATPDQYGWYKTVLYLEDYTLTLENNGKKIFTQTAIEGKIPQNRCPLYIAGRGQGFDRSEDFYGYMDNIFLVKDCRFHEANIKIL